MTTTADDAERQSRHERLATSLAAASDDALLSLLASTDGATGWGVSRVVEVDGHSVFAKAIPVTDLELAAEDPTANLFELPIAYQYGVGSAGFGAMREVAAHHKTTEWVLSAACPHFPMLYHHRVLPLSGLTRTMDAESLDHYVDYWDGSDAVRRYMVARQQSTAAYVLFCEHVPFVLDDWLPENQDAVETLIAQAVTITDFMRSHDVAHMDAHRTNVVTDGQRIFVADFGLWLDRDFALSEAEQSFLTNHRWYDIAEFLCGLSPDIPGAEFEATSEYLAAVQPYQPVIDTMMLFIRSMQKGPKRTNLYDDAEIRRLLPSG